MRLTDLRPQWGRTDQGMHLWFVCPTCGPPCIISILIGDAVSNAPKRWRAMPMPDAPDWPSRVSISPSIDNTTAGHGPHRPPCLAHFHVVNGDIVP